MQKLLTLIVLGMLTLGPASSAQASEKYLDFPLNTGEQSMSDSLSSHDFSISSSCTVKKNTENPFYEYTVTLDYETSEEKLLLWNFLDWILSPYPNAIATAKARPNLFLLKKGSGNYVFHFRTTEKPLWFQDTIAHIFSPHRFSLNSQNHQYGGISVSPDNYVSSELSVGFMSCLPENLLVFPQNERSGF